MKQQLRDLWDHWFPIQTGNFVLDCLAAGMLGFAVGKLL
jgi:hypothetical protein